MPRINNLTLPPQRLSYKKKTKKWRQDNVDYADKHAFYHNESVRKSLRNKIINYNLYNGVVDIRDLTDIVNPYHLDASFIPDNIPHHPIAVPKIDLLVGEEIKRRFDWKVVVSNSDAVSEKENEKKKVLFRKMVEMLQANYEGEELNAEFEKLNKYMKYDWQDLREKMANQILRHYWKEQNFDLIFNQGFKDALISAEEVYQVDIVHDEPVLTKLNPLKVHAVRSGNSDKIEDCSIIILEDHWSPGRIVDYFHHELKEKDIDYILEYTTTKSGGAYHDDYNNHVLLRDSLDGVSPQDSLNSIFNIAELNGHYFGSDFTDENGNIRVLRVYWKSLKKVKKVKYYDENGDVQFKIMSEEYILDQNMGEESTDLWINEWWEGTKIGKDIYLQMKPRSVQYNKLNNPSYCHPGIIGQIYNTNQGKAVSLMDRCKNYQYMYDVMWDRLNKAISTNYGKIFEMDLAKVPDNWEIEKWLHFAVVNKIAIVDSFKEGNQGAATGKLAGGFNTQGGRSIDMDLGNYIQQQILMLEFIKNEMGEIAGVTKQREGQVSNRETVGGVERAVNQSAHITEYWFHMHEKVKLRVLGAFLEAAKIALQGDNKKAQYILDDQTIAILNMDGSMISDVDFGLVSTASAKTVELESTMKQYAQAFLQNGGRLSSIMDIYFSPSLSDMRRKLEEAEDEITQQQSKAAEDANKLAQQQEANKQQLEFAKIEAEDIKNIRDNETKLLIAANPKEESTDDGIAEEKLELDREKHQDDKFLKIKELSDKMVMHKDNLAVKKTQANKSTTTK